MRTEEAIPGFPDPPSPGGQKPKRRIARWILALTGIGVVCFAVIVASASPQNPNAVAPSRIVGHFAPALSGETLSGANFNFAQLRGHYVLVNFFASWCVPCRAETAAFITFLSHAPGQVWGSQVKIVGVTVNDRETSTRAFVRQLGVTWPVIFDGSGADGLAWGVDNPPQTFLVAPNGKVVTRIVGAVTAPGLNSLINLAYSTYG